MTDQHAIAGRTPKTCTGCGEAGHNRRKCTKNPVPPPTDMAPERDYSDESIAAVAAMREELDGLDGEIADYEVIEARVAERLTEMRARRDFLTHEIRRLRAARRTAEWRATR